MFTCYWLNTLWNFDRQLTLTVLCCMFDCWLTVISWLFKHFCWCDFRRRLLAQTSSGCFRCVINFHDAKTVLQITKAVKWKVPGCRSRCCDWSRSTIQLDTRLKGPRPDRSCSRRSHPSRTCCCRRCRRCSLVGTCRTRYSYLHRIVILSCRSVTAEGLAKPEISFRCNIVVLVRCYRSFVGWVSSRTRVTRCWTLFNVTPVVTGCSYVHVVAITPRRFAWISLPK